METCIICGKTVKDKRGLSGHMQFSHPGNQPVASCELAQLKQQINALTARLESVLPSAFSAKNTNTEEGVNMDEFVTKKDLEIAKLKEDLAVAKSGGVAVARAEAEDVPVTKKDLEIQRLKDELAAADVRALEIPSVDEVVEHCKSGCATHRAQLRKFMDEVLAAMSPAEVKVQMARLKIYEAPNKITIGIGDRELKR